MRRLRFACLPLREAIEPGVEGEQDRGQVGGRVAVRHRAADRAPGADLRVGEDRERVGDGGTRGGARVSSVDGYPD